MTPEQQAILAARTRRLARVPSRRLAAAGERYLTAVVDEARYAIVGNAVMGVTSVRQIAKLPGVLAGTAGLISFRSAPIVAFDTTHVLGQPRQRLAERTQALVLGRHQAEAALLVDAVESVVEIVVDQLLPPQKTIASQASELIAGITDDGVVVLNASELLESKRMEARTYLRRAL